MKVLPPQSSVMKIVVGPAAVALCLMALPTGLARAAEELPDLSCPSCEDYNACTIDSCDTTTGTCRHDPLNCDDGNPCTNDSCSAHGTSSLGCHNFNRTAGSACDDGDACTSADACDGSGRCLGQPQPPGSACDDGNLCTTGDACDDTGACTGIPLPSGTECDDTNACTRGEQCLAGPDGSIACQGAARHCDDDNPCTTDTCNPITDDCIHTQILCDDGNPCTDDACDTVTGACFRTNREGLCDDRNICTEGESCSDGNCLGGSPSRCGWGNQCGFAICDPVANSCLTAPNPSDCPPPVQCHGYQCVFGRCIPVDVGGACSDGNPCTTEVCLRGGCFNNGLLNGGPCDDASACTTGDVCQVGSCRGTFICSDGDACTDDLCDPATGTCLGRSPRNCDDGNPCTTDSCNPATGCVHILNNDPCDDHSACTDNDHCSNGSCVGAPVVTCPDDGNPCTTEGCNTATGACFQFNNAAPCDDGDRCTGPGFCQNGSCHPGLPTNCNDFNVCTHDSCEPATGACVYAPEDGPCSDGNACTADDRCVTGTCAPGPPANCDDGDPCTSDTCNVISGCIHGPLTGGPCSDGNPCTTGDACASGICRPSAPVSCLDGNPCTIDYCDRSAGACIHQIAVPACDDGNVCTVDLCDRASGTCLGHDPVDCDDGDSCTSDACDPATGCTHVFTCPQDVVDIRLSFTSPVGRGSGTLTWRTTAEDTLSGFNILLYNQQGVGVPINLVLIPCTECLTRAGASYTFYLPKHRSGHNVFIQTIGRDGKVLGTFGPAQKEP